MSKVSKLNLPVYKKKEIGQNVQKEGLPAFTTYTPSKESKLMKAFPTIGTKEYIKACEENFNGTFDIDVSCTIAGITFKLEILDHHKFPINYLTLDNVPYNSELVYHNVGTGKTRVGLGLAIKAIQQGMHVYVVLPSTLVKIWKDELLSEKILKNVPDKDYQTVYDVINKHLTFIKINDTKNFVKNMHNNDYSSSMMIVDESHTFISMIYGNEKNKSSTVKNIFFEKKRPKKLALLTATPVINNPIELARTLNVLTGDINYFNLHSFDADYIDRINLKLKDSARVLFLHKMMGYISYYRDEIHRDNYPRMIGTVNEVTLKMNAGQSSGVIQTYHQERDTAFKKAKKLGINMDEDDVGNFFTKSRMASIFYHPKKIHGNHGRTLHTSKKPTDANSIIDQWDNVYERYTECSTVFENLDDEYLKSLSLSEDVIDIISTIVESQNDLNENIIATAIQDTFPIDDNKDAILKYLNNYFDSLINSLLEINGDALREFTIVYHKLIGNELEDDPEHLKALEDGEKNFFIENITSVIDTITDMQSIDISDDLQQKILLKELDDDDNEDAMISTFIADHAVEIKNKGEWSIKFQWLADMINRYLEKGEKCLIYSYFIKESLKPFASFLQLNNYHNILTSTTYKSGAHGKGFLLVNGDLSIDLRKKHLDICNEPKNDYGSKCGIILGSGVMSEGFTLKTMRHVIFIEPFWNMSKFLQVIGRVDRYMSHSTLPAEKQNYDVTVLLAEPTEPEAFIERYIYNVAIRKHKKITNVLNDVRNVCIDRKNLSLIEKGSIDIFKYSAILDDNILKVYNDKNIQDKHIFAPLFKIEEHIFMMLKIPETYYVKCTKHDTLNSASNITECDIDEYRDKKCYYAYKLSSIKEHKFIGTKQPDGYIFLIKDPDTDTPKYTLVKHSDVIASQ